MISASIVMEAAMPFALTIATSPNGISVVEEEIHLFNFRA
jgi:hypothetical protein